MSKKANPTLIGGFVVGAVTLVVGGLLAFGSVSFLTEEEFCMVAHFPSSVNGLSVGAPIKLRGVQVGRVTAVNAVWTGDEDGVNIPVELTFGRSIIRAPTPEIAADIQSRDPIEVVEGLIEQGLRAELKLESFVTGRLFVALDFHEDADDTRLGDTELPEMPTIETGLLRLRKTLEEVPVEEVIRNAVAALEAIEEFATSGKIDRMADNLDGLVVDFRGLVAHVDQRIDPLSESALATLEGIREITANADEELREVSRDLQTLLEGADEHLGPLAASAAATLEETREAVAILDRFLVEDPTLFYRFADLLQELTETARAVRTLASYLERHPEALLKGKGGG